MSVSLGGVVVPEITQDDNSCTILEVVQNATLALGIEEPSTLFGTQDRTEKELIRVANQMAERIRKKHSWQALTFLHTMTGDGAADEFLLPTDYGRMPKDTQMWSSRYFAPLPHVPSFNDNLNIATRGFSFTTPVWHLKGNKVNFYPALAASETVQYNYISRNVVTDAAGVKKEKFTSDSDVFALDCLLLELGIIWQYKASKSMPYAEDLANYENELARQISEDKGARVLTQRSAGRISGQLAYPTSITP